MHRSGLGTDLRQGLKLFGQQRSLKLLAGTVAALAFSQNMVFGLMVVYGKRTLHLTNTGYGVFLAAASLVGVVGAFSGGRLQRRFGPARLIVGGAVLATSATSVSPSPGRPCSPCSCSVCRRSAWPSPTWAR